MPFLRRLDGTFRDLEDRAASHTLYDDERVRIQGEVQERVLQTGDPHETRTGFFLSVVTITYTDPDGDHPGAPIRLDPTTPHTLVRTDLPWEAAESLRVVKALCAHTRTPYLSRRLVVVPGLTLTVCAYHCETIMGTVYLSQAAGTDTRGAELATGLAVC